MPSGACARLRSVAPVDGTAADAGVGLAASLGRSASPFFSTGSSLAFSTPVKYTTGTVFSSAFLPAPRAFPVPVVPSSFLRFRLAYSDIGLGAGGGAVAFGSADLGESESAVDGRAEDGAADAEAARAEGSLS